MLVAGCFHMALGTPLEGLAGAVSNHLVQEIMSSRGILFLIIEKFNESFKSEKC